MPFPRKRLASSAAGGASPLSPHGDGNLKKTVKKFQVQDAIPTPRGDGNSDRMSRKDSRFRRDPYPLRGRKPCIHKLRQLHLHTDAIPCTVMALRFPALAGRQSCHILESGSLHPPQAALRRLNTVAPAGSLPLCARQPGCFLESGSLYPPLAALRRLNTVAPAGSRPLCARQPGCFLESGSLHPPQAALRPLEHRCTNRFPAASRPPTGVLPRKRLAPSAAGGASPLSPLASAGNPGPLALLLIFKGERNIKRRRPMRAAVFSYWLSAGRERRLTCTAGTGR